MCRLLVVKFFGLKLQRTAPGNFFRGPTLIDKLSIRTGARVLWRRKISCHSSHSSCKMSDKIDRA